jgi:hypothetical protein
MAYEFAAAFDNGGETHDRYRVVICDFEADDEGRPCVAFVMGERVSDMTEYADVDAYPGETEIAFETLPEFAKRKLAGELALFNS